MFINQRLFGRSRLSGEQCPETRANDGVYTRNNSAVCWRIAVGSLFRNNKRQPLRDSFKLSRRCIKFTGASSYSVFVVCSKRNKTCPLFLIIKTRQDYFPIHIGFYYGVKLKGSVFNQYLDILALRKCLLHCDLYIKMVWSVTEIIGLLFYSSTYSNY